MLICVYVIQKDFVKHQTCHSVFLTTRTGRMRCYFFVCVVDSAENGDMQTGVLHRHVSLCFALWSDIKSVKSPDPWRSCQTIFGTQTLAHTRIREGEGQPAWSMMEGENIHGGAGGEADAMTWLTQVFPLWMHGYSNWSVYNPLIHRGLIKGTVWHFEDQ